MIFYNLTRDEIFEVGINLTNHDNYMGEYHFIFLNSENELSRLTESEKIEFIGFL